ncbi:MAG: VWA domain-containing protein [Anaerolineae bacterium]|nr:VWA domain-containing protein [Anaerolineae bacterium]MDQ7035966.1 VWA domain-containing protein [Anaerolineae bacterium]
MTHNDNNKKSQVKGVYLGSQDNDTHYEGGQLLHNLLLFGRVCRALGMNVTPNRMMEVARALEHIELGNKIDFYHTLRTFMVTHPKEFDYYDEAFDIFWRRPTDEWTTLDLRPFESERLQKKKKFVPPSNSSPSDDDTQPQDVDPMLTAVVATYSQQESLRYRDFAEMTVQELEMAKRIMERLPESLGTRKTRRYKRGKGRQIDLRRTLRESMRRGGDVLHLPTRTPNEKPRPVVLICDISGSMERYTRVLLHFLHTMAVGMTQVESFVFSTQLTRITRQIRQKSVDEALAEVGRTVKQWGGGTNTGESLHSFNYDWSRRVLGRGAIVMMITDGWDRGDRELLEHEVARLGRSCERLIWLNPLLDSPDYEPLTRGAQAILPYIDDFLPIRNLANLEAIIKALQGLNMRTALPYQKKYAR